MTKHFDTPGLCRPDANADGALPPADALGIITAILENDSLPLSRAKVLWLFGEWEKLAALNLGASEQHPDRDRLALLIACAHQQLGQHDAALEYTRLALRYGCPPRIVAQILISGVHNTIGRMAALRRDDKRMAKHFEEAVAVVASQHELSAVSYARSIKELTQLGLLPHAFGLATQALQKASRDSPGRTTALIKMLETKLDLLSSELSLAQQRQQLFRPPAGDEPFNAGASNSEWLEALQRKSVSQLGQDLWVLEQTGYKRGGFFVEFGATDGVLLSNTYLLEKEFGWGGICAEPNSKLFEQLKKNRTCAVSDACIAGVTGREVEFIFADAYGCMAEHADADSHTDKRRAYAALGNTTRLKTVSLDDFLKQNNAPYDIDYLSIDTEGSELEIISTFPFHGWNVKLLTIEHNFTPQRDKIFDLLTALGYRRLECQWDDWYWRS